MARHCQTFRRIDPATAAPGQDAHVSVGDRHGRRARPGALTHAGLQVNVEPIASHQQSTIAYVRRLLDNRRPAGLQAIREMLAGSVDPVTPLQVHTCIDGLLPGLVDDRRSFDVAEEADVGGLVVSD